MVELHDDATIIRERMASHEWWILFATPNMLHVTTAIEEEFYADEANEDFQLLLCVGQPFLGFFFAHKRRMSSLQLGNFLKEHAGESVPTLISPLLEERDLFVFLGPGEEDMGLDFFNWLMTVGTKVEET